ncbi:MAG: CDP-diacylglycerol--glycerol-3-phosphate 3-phosphatidyltransferase [Rhodanobacter sp.]|jgi:CDP-diacylglycerol--glycerol-3-phosphate 3-phosphatidyltransferase|nr:CDP-diacylglycerol--glycerol-3-phosphate 3-phosphatidyltransferase [Rhodanobacter sp.]
MTITIPTVLTLFRILLLPVMVVVFYADFRGANIAAAAIFVTAAVTDWLDGWIARRYDMSSAFGAFLDPVADKLMVAITLFLLVQENPTPLMAVTSAIIVGREISISALREWMAEIGARATVRVATIGKIKTVMQIVAIVVLLYQHDLDSQIMFFLGETLLVIAAVLTIWSGLQYVRTAWPVLRKQR